VLRREDEDNKNLFVRLTSQTVQDLFQEAIIHNDTLPHQSSPSLEGWSVDEEALDTINFLPLQISFSDRVLYASYNGGAPSLEREGTDPNQIVELPSSLFSPQSPPTNVHIRALPFIANADKVSLEPLSPEDWELLEIHCDYLESGGFLRQVTVINASQILHLAVGSQDVARVRVVNPAEPNACCRLVATTEVVVIPKTRKKPPTASPELGLLPTSDALSNQMREFVAHQGLSVPSIRRGYLMIHPNTLHSSVPGWDEDDNDLEYAMVWGDKADNAVILARILPSGNIAQGSVGIHSLDCLQMNLTPLYDKIRLKLVRRSEINSIASKTKNLINQGDIQLGTKLSHLGAFHQKCSPFSNFTIHDFQVSPSTFLTEGAFVSEKLNTLCIQRNGLFSKTNDSGSNVKLLPQFILHGDFLPFLISRQDASLVSDSNTLNIQSWEMLNYLPPTSHIDLFAEEGFVRNADITILVASTGGGKTHQAITIAAMERIQCNRASFYLDCRQLGSSANLKMNSILETITCCFQEAVASAPSVLILDDLETICPQAFADDDDSERTETNSSLNEESHLISSHIQVLFEAALTKQIKFVLTTESRPIGSMSVFGDALVDVIQIPTLTSISQQAVLKKMVGPGCVIPDDTVSKIGLKLGSFRPKDISVLASRIHHIIRTQVLMPTLDELEEIAADLIPLARQGIASDYFNQVQLKWDDIGGLFDAKEKLEDSIVNPIKFRRIYERAPLRTSQAVLLFGPPGSGKSMLVPALAEFCGLTLITCRGPELLDRYIGASEAKVRKLFEQAEAAAPSLLFFDEFDALAPRRGTDHTGVTDRVVNQLLTYLDGVEGRSHAVYIVATTSRPDKIDTALLRPGRLEQHIYVGFPGTRKEWTDVGRKMVASYCLNPEAIEFVESGAFVDAGALLQNYWSAVDLKAALDTAYLEAVNACLRVSEKEPQPVVTRDILETSLCSTRPSLSKPDRTSFDLLNQQFMGLSGTSGTNASEGGQLKVTLK